MLESRVKYSVTLTFPEAAKLAVSDPSETHLELLPRLKRVPDGVHYARAHYVRNNRAHTESVYNRHAFGTAESKQNGIRNGDWLLGAVDSGKVEPAP